ncbi:MAG: hypothetical protein H7230_03225 [Candidatus Parcubacteria bacterium]|nr:hypothetical protein [Candidatus Paceibacterota bacterium]
MPPKIYIVLNNIRSAWNVGAIMRTCDALEMKMILIGYTPKPIGSNLKLITKTAIGAENTVPWEHYDHYQSALQRYSKNCYHYGIEIDVTSVDIVDYLFNQRKLHQLLNQNPIEKSSIFLWLGNEIHGLEQDLMSQMTANLHLYMQGTKESLNVSNCMTAVSYLFNTALRLDGDSN